MRGLVTKIAGISKLTVSVQVVALFTKELATFSNPDVTVSQTVTPPEQSKKKTAYGGFPKLLCSGGRIRTCDQSITRILKFLKGVDYIITIFEIFKSVVQGASDH